jgi:hypothetical protein
MWIIDCRGSGFTSVLFESYKKRAERGPCLLRRLGGWKKEKKRRKKKEARKESP